jgi:hypothetical protein
MTSSWTIPNSASGHVNATLDEQGCRLQSVDPTESPFIRTRFYSEYAADALLTFVAPFEVIVLVVGLCPPFVCFSGPSFVFLPKRSWMKRGCGTPRYRSDKYPLSSEELSNLHEVFHLLFTRAPDSLSDDRRQQRLCLGFNRANAMSSITRISGHKYVLAISRCTYLGAFHINAEYT